MVKATPSDPIRVPPGGRVELECTVFGSPVPQAQWNRGIQLNQVNRSFKMYNVPTYYYLLRIKSFNCML